MNKGVTRTPPPIPKPEVTKAPAQTIAIKIKMSKRLGEETGPSK
jgi:hypothetical protein